MAVGTTVSRVALESKSAAAQLSLSIHDNSLLSEFSLVDIFLMDADGKTAFYQKLTSYRTIREELSRYREGVSADGYVTDFATMRGIIVETQREHGFYISQIDLGTAVHRGTPFTNVYTAKLHDCFTRYEEHWTQEIAFPTTHLVVQIHFPEARPPKVLRCFIVEGTSDKEIATTAAITELFGRKAIVWQLESPRLNDIYKIIGASTAQNNTAQKSDTWQLGGHQAHHARGGLLHRHDDAEGDDAGCGVDHRGAAAKSTRAALFEPGAILCERGCRSAPGWFVDQLARQIRGDGARGSPWRSSDMRFMFIVKSAHAGSPPPALLEAMHKLADREIKAGRMLDSGGLMPAATGAEVRIKGGHLSVVDGPFVEAKEVIGGYAVFDLRDKDEALASAKEFMQLHKDLFPGWEGICELRALASGGP
jgi:hypothetical protein